MFCGLLLLSMVWKTCYYCCLDNFSFGNEVMLTTQYIHVDNIHIHSHGTIQGVNGVKRGRVQDDSYCVAEAITIESWIDLIQLWMSHLAYVGRIALQLRKSASWHSKTVSTCTYDIVQAPKVHAITLNCTWSPLRQIKEVSTISGTRFYVPLSLRLHTWTKSPPLIWLCHSLFSNLTLLCICGGCLTFFFFFQLSLGHYIIVGHLWILNWIVT